MNSNSSQASLVRGVGLVGVVMFGAGTAIGVSIFSVLQPAAQLAGSGLLLAIAIAAVPMVLFAATYAYLGSALPVAGASYEWPRRFVHPLAGFLIAWMRILSNVGALTVLSLVLVKYLGMVWPLPLKPTMAAAITLVFVLNYVGVTVAARAQIVLMSALLLLLAAFVLFGLPDTARANIGPLVAMGWPAVGAAVPLLISLFLGIESSVEIGEEVRDPQRNLPLGIGLAILLTAVVYASVAFVALGLVGPARLAASDAPLLEAARLPFGPWAVPLVVGAAAVSILKAMNANTLVFTRSLFAMGRAGVLPAGIAAIHPRFGTPHRAIALAYVAAMSGLLLPLSLVFLLLAVNIPTMLKYLACSLAAVRVASQHPEIHGASRLGFSRRTVYWIGGASMLCAATISLLGLEADVRPYELVGGWAAIGLVYWIATARMRANA